MGEIADWHLENIQEEIVMRGSLARKLFNNYSDSELVEMCESCFYESEFTPMVKGICATFLSQEDIALSNKQRKALAIYISQDPEAV